MNAITINQDQRLFVLQGKTGYSCLGFDVVYKRLREYAARLGRPAPDIAETGTLPQLRAYFEAESALVRLNPQDTIFDPDTPPTLKAVLEACRHRRNVVRLFTGNVETGRDWLGEWDTIGQIGRSMGAIKVPLLVPKGDNGGGAILTACVLRVVDVASGKDLWRHPAYQVPVLTVRETADADVCEKYPFEVMRDDAQGTPEVQARFKTQIEASNWVAFMRGERHSLPRTARGRRS